MKVAFYCTDPKIKTIKLLEKNGGSGTLSSLLYVANGISKLGYDVSICGKFDPQHEEEINLQLKFYNVETHSEFINFTKLEQFDVVIVVGHAFDIFETERILTPKVIYWAHNWVDLGGLIKHCRKGKLDKIVFVSRYHFLRSVVRYNKDKIDIYAIKYLDWIFNPMDLTIFPVSDNLLIESTNKGPELSFLSFPSLNKGLPEAISLFTEVRKHYPNATMNIFGSQKLYDSQISGYGDCHHLLFDEFGISKPGLKIHGLLGKTDLVKIISNSDLAVAGLTGSETFCLALTEAMACFVPAVSLNKGGQVDYIKNGVNGYIGKNNSQISKLVLEHFNKHKDEIKVMRMNSKATVKRFESGEISKQWDVLIRNNSKSNIFTELKKLWL